MVIRLVHQKINLSAVRPEFSRGKLYFHLIVNTAYDNQNIGKMHILHKTWRVSFSSIIRIMNINLCLIKDIKPCNRDKTFETSGISRFL